jgi:hypothetical protein
MDELIRAKARNKRWLHEGEKVRLEEGGALYEVERVTLCSALLRSVYAKPKLVEIPGREPFEATRGERIHVAPNAFVIREEVD